MISDVNQLGNNFFDSVTTRSYDSFLADGHKEDELPKKVKVGTEISLRQIIAQSFGDRFYEIWGLYLASSGWRYFNTKAEAEGMAILHGHNVPSIVTRMKCVLDF